MHKKIHPKYRLGRPLLMDIDGIEHLVDLALDMHSAWNHKGDKLWQALDPDLWELTRNPWGILQTASRDKIIEVLTDPVFKKMLKDIIQDKQQRMESSGWFQNNHANSDLSCIAYFSMEFMLSEALPIYSGGLGNVAGDQLKAASDLGVPVVGIGLLYQRGYFRQMIDKDGRQLAFYSYNDPGQLPISPVRQENGEWLRIKITLPGYYVWLKVWQAQVGRVTLYLLDSNDAANLPVHQGITSELYGGGPELRLQQEMILGIAGWLVLKALKLKPEVCHLNEGHAALAVLERARSFMRETGVSFEEALTITRAGNLFTTHTAVAAGFDLFTPALIEQYLGDYAKNALHISLDELLALGRNNPEDSSELFNMAYLAIRGSGAVNGVSQLHGRVSRHIFQPLFPRWPKYEIPVGHVTNGVHMPSWDSPVADEIWTCSCGKDRWMGMTKNLAKNIHCLSDSTLWEFRTQNRHALIEFARKRLSRDLAASGAPLHKTDEAKTLFDPNILTLGFARRFATYKRPNLLLQNPERLFKLLTNPERPVQLLLAGKAHPLDYPGQALIQQWIRFIHQPEVRKHVMFLSDYDMSLTERLVQGVDVWLNTPRRPWEACGTSGMKVLVNGGINISELDGWWAEAYTPDVGWALGDGQEHDDDPAWDVSEANALYDLLEQEVIPTFYNRDSRGIPPQWVAKMRESMATLTPVYSAERAVRQYTEQYYLPAARAWNQRSAKQGETGKAYHQWIKNLDTNWEHLWFGDIKIDSTEEGHHFEVQVYTDDIDTDAIKIQLYAEGLDGALPEIYDMQQADKLIGAVHGYEYSVFVKTQRPASHYTPRIVPFHAHIKVPLEANHILWHK